MECYGIQLTAKFKVQILCACDFLATLCCNLKAETNLHSAGQGPILVGPDRHKPAHKSHNVYGQYTLSMIELQVKNRGFRKPQLGLGVAWDHSAGKTAFRVEG